ncbi:catechol 2,3-dioxygenase [Devosia enhydra]|uniref:Catechol 2,3-dioxygenase n=1 Tax=Devosia enhydra TaxID=665118 RepID=A0A1K2I1Q9_9HYPH|nr:VOC family protein [Devosia enhydra]SFZ86317.1 catechol 2,3-dioxygenase [Devosia enhydra]
MFAVESQAAVRSAPILPVTTTLGPVRIGITDTDRALAIWRDVVGLDVLAETADTLSLGIGEAVLIELVRDAVRPVVPNTTGLYHVAIHVPTRRDLAAMAARALERRVRISPTDHLVSEAIYLWDADGNGIEITFETPWRGRPGGPEEGAYAIATDGRPHSGREPIDLRGLLAELGQGPIPSRMPQGTRIGHVHVHVTDLYAALRFYRDGLGFGGLFIMAEWGMGDVTLDYMPHAIAFNIWAGPNARPAPAGAAGLRHFTIVVPDAETLAAMRDRLSAIGVTVTPIDGGFEARDPAQNRVRLVARA